MTKDEYNEEPVFYCKQCLSLKVMGLDNLPDSDYCDICGSTQIETTSIAEWENMYENKHGVKYINN